MKRALFALLLTITICASATNTASHQESAAEQGPWLQFQHQAKPQQEPRLGASERNPVHVKTADDPNAATLARWTVLLGVGTFILGGVGFVQALIVAFQLKQMRGDSKVAEMAAIAAERSAKVAEDALTKLEAPQVFVDARIEPKGFLAVGAKHAKVIVYNHGRTIAHLVRLAAWGASKRPGEGEPAYVAPVFQPDERLPYGVVAAKGEPHSEVFEVRWSQPFGAQSMESDQVDCWLHGLVDYEDTFGRMFRVRFSFRYNGAHNRFARAGTYNDCKPFDSQQSMALA